jgi:hypothetical protein
MVTIRRLGDTIGSTPVSNMTGLPLFISAALEDCRSIRQTQVLKSEVLQVMPDQARDLGTAAEQRVVDVVCSVMGRAWRPGPRWRERLVSIGRHDLASW